MDTISISEIQRNLHKLDDFDIVEVVDKKRHQIKGYFLDKKYHDVVEALLNENRKKMPKNLKHWRSWALMHWVVQVLKR